MKHEQTQIEAKARVLGKDHQTAGQGLPKVSAWVSWTFAVYNLVGIGGIGQWWDPSPT